MPRFRVKAGSHVEVVEGAPVRFPQGSEFDSAHDLVAVFGPEKFERLPDAPSAKAEKAKAEKGDK